MKRLAAALLAAGLLLVAAAGLASGPPDDYCFANRPAFADASSGGSTETLISAWPPGPRCRWETNAGAVTAETLGSVSAFLIMVAGGAVAVFRRNRYTWATLIVLAVAGVLALEFGLLEAVVVGALLWGSLAALVATRSPRATFVAVGVLIAWAALLAVVSFADLVLGPADKRVVRYLTGPRPEF